MSVRIYLTDDEYAAVRAAIDDYAFLEFRAKCEEHETNEINCDKCREAGEKLTKSIHRKFEIEATDHLQTNWRDDDSPHGEFASSSSPKNIAA